MKIKIKITDMINQRDHFLVKIDIGVNELKRIKRIVSGALAFACAAAAAVSVLPMVSAFAASTAVTTDYLNLRTGAGTGSSVVLTLSKGVTVTVLDNSNAQWTKVQTASGKQGYCSKQYLSY